VPFIRYLTFANTELLLVNNLQAHREVLQTKCYEFEKPEFFCRVVGELVGVGLLLPRGKSTKCGRSLHHRQPFGHLPMYIVRL
jgi:hypothetical protein